MNELYAWYKEHGRCPRCGGDPVRGGVFCVNCLDKAGENSRKYRLSRNEEEKEKIKKATRECVKELRKNRIKDGVCIDCGKRPVYAGTQRCGICRYKLNKKNRERWQLEKGNRSHEERLEKDKCYICGEPVVKNKRVCQKCLETRRQSIENANKYVKNNEFRRTMNSFYRGKRCGTDKK